MERKSKEYLTSTPIVTYILRLMRLVNFQRLLKKLNLVLDGKSLLL